MRASRFLTRTSAVSPHPTGLPPSHGVELHTPDQHAPLVEETQAPRFPRHSFLAAIKRDEARRWLDAPDDKIEYLRRLFSAASSAAETTEPSFAKDVVIQRLVSIVKDTRCLPKLRRHAEAKLRSLVPPIPLPWVPGRKPRRVTPAERTLLKKTTIDGVMKHWIKPRDERTSEMRQALLDEFRGDGDDGVPRLRQLQGMQPALVARYILAARVSLRDEQRKVDDRQIQPRPSFPHSRQ